MYTFYLMVDGLDGNGLVANLGLRSSFFIHPQKTGLFEKKLGS
jgi:hypothetical protein